MPGSCSTDEGAQSRQVDRGRERDTGVGAAGRGAPEQGLRGKEVSTETQSPAGLIVSRKEKGTYLPCHINDKQ